MPRLDVRALDIAAVVFGHAPIHDRKPQRRKISQYHHAGIAGRQLRRLVEMPQRWSKCRSD
jgi:hypothetical protein